MRVLIYSAVMAAIALTGSTQSSRAEGKLTVIELFTSQGCSSCPPADALLTNLAAHDPALLPLDFHVTYWDRLGWKDPYSLPEATARQRRYAQQWRLDTVYTPQMVVGGRREMVGSDRNAVQAALLAGRQDETVPLRLTQAGAGLQITAGPGRGTATVLLIGYDPQHDTPIRAGENSGRTLHEVNVVRSVTEAGTWSGSALTLAAARPLGEAVAVLLQAQDGRIIGASTLAPP